MLRIEFLNDGTGDWIDGNYNYKVYVNDEKISEGRIEHHNRLSGWQGLVNCLSKQVFEDPN